MLFLLGLPGDDGLGPFGADHWRHFLILSVHQLHLTYATSIHYSLAAAFPDAARLVLRSARNFRHKKFGRTAGPIGGSQDQHRLAVRPDSSWEERSFHKGPEPLRGGMCFYSCSCLAGSAEITSVIKYSVPAAGINGESTGDHSSGARTSPAMSAGPQLRHER